MKFVGAAIFPAVEKLNEAEAVVFEIAVEHVYRPLYPASGEHESVEQHQKNVA